MKKSDNISTLAAALVNAQAKIGAAKKDSENPFFKSKYADLGQIIEACKDALLENGLTVLQLVGRNGDGKDYLDTIILHESGEFISEQMNLSISQQNNPQAVGSAITYARRYALQSAMLIPTEDDDGEAAAKPAREDQAIGERQDRREREAARMRQENIKAKGEYARGSVDAEQKLKDANRALLEASEGRPKLSHGASYVPPPEKPVQGNVAQPQTESWQDVICTYGKKDGPLRGKTLGQLGSAQLQFLYTMFGKKPLSEIDPQDRLLAVAIRDWNGSLDKADDEVPF
jgi:hypothetical protein